MQSGRPFTGGNTSISATTKKRLSSLVDTLTPENPHRDRLRELFREIEKEFDQVYADNLYLQEKYDALLLARANETPLTTPSVATPGTESVLLQRSDPLEVESTIAASSIGGGGGSASKSGLKSKISSSGTTTGPKVKTSHKIKAQTSKIVSSFKAHSVVSSVIREYSGHKDGVWHVAAKLGQPLIGSASADHTACIWGTESGRCLLQYYGHQGSVNSIRFHPTQDLVLTSSGDGTAHIWHAAVNYERYKKPTKASDDELTEDSDDDNRIDTLRTPLCELGGSQGHSSVVAMADWVVGAEQVITAGWDRIAILWSVETKEPVQSLTGHDSELTFASAHPSQRLVVTASRDSTFRLWDFRDQIPAVSVFQGHTESVTSAVLTKDDKVVSGSDDRSVKVWELRNMRSALAHIRLDSAVNRLSVLNSAVIAIPHDNRDVRLFDLQGQRIARLTRTNRQGHTRMVSCVAWSDDPTSSTNLYSAGFDKRVIGWNVCLPKDNN